jgi:hypothetical protein
MANEVPGVIEPGRLYVADEARQRLRIGRTTWGDLCKAGLRVVRRGKRSYVFGDDVLRVFAQQAEREGAHHAK